jgi:hypothetical protein
MRMLADVTVTVISGDRKRQGTVYNLEFDDEAYQEFDFAHLFRELINGLQPTVLTLFPKERFIFDVHNIRPQYDRRPHPDVYDK